MTPEDKRRIEAEWECQYAFHLMKVIDQGLEGIEAKRVASRWTTDLLIAEYRGIMDDYVNQKFKEQ